MVSALQSYYAERGYRNATILPRLDDERPVPERAELVLAIDAGARTTIGDATVTRHAARTAPPSC